MEIPDHPKGKAAKRTARKVGDILIILGFLVFLAFPASLAHRVDNTRFTNFVERRQLSPLPPSWKNRENWGQFPSRAESFIEDRLAGRQQFIRLHAMVEYFIFHESSRSIIFGQDSWMFATGLTMSAYRGISRIKESQLKIWEDFLHQRLATLEERGSRYLLTVTPRKPPIYPEFLPAVYQTRKGETPTDTFSRFLQDGLQISLIDPREALIASKEREQTYLRTDGHWNDFGAHTGYLEVMKRVEDFFPEVEPLRRSDFQEKVHLIEDGLMARRSGISELFNEEEILLEPGDHLPKPTTVKFAPIQDAAFSNLRSRNWTVTEYRDAEGPVVLLLHDSFGEPWRKWFPYNFSKFVSVRTDDLVSDKQLKVLLDALEPDLVIEQFTSRKIIPMPGVRESLAGKQ